jgi:hypothetical protein
VAVSVKSYKRGHPIRWIDGHWFLKRPDGLCSLPNNLACAYCERTPEFVYVTIPSDLSCTGEKKWKLAQIDACIAPLVEALQRGGIEMRGSCCGHGRQPGEIHLQDGRMLLVFETADQGWAVRDAHRRAQRGS